MIQLYPQSLDEKSICPYLKDGRERQFRYFFATQLNSSELGVWLRSGWRKFGMYYYKPECPQCQSCSPLRVVVKDFKISKSMRRCWNKGKQVFTISIDKPKFSDRAFEIYQKHSQIRFNQKSGDKEHFIESFYLPSAPMLQTNLYLGNELMGVGYLDICDDGMSSVYFAFDPVISDYSPGTFSILAEIDYVKQQNKDYYYLGYWVKNCQALDYKQRFHPCEVYLWDNDSWVKGTPTSLATDAIG